jgi:hypothetical protein
VECDRHLLLSRVPSGRVGGIEEVRHGERRRGTAGWEEVRRGQGEWGRSALSARVVKTMATQIPQSLDRPLAVAASPIRETHRPGGMDTQVDVAPQFVLARVQVRVDGGEEDGREEACVADESDIICEKWRRLRQVDVGLDDIHDHAKDDVAVSQSALVQSFDMSAQGVVVGEMDVRSLSES